MVFFVILTALGTSGCTLSGDGDDDDSSNMDITAAYFTVKYGAQNKEDYTAASSSARHL